MNSNSKLLTIVIIFLGVILLPFFAYPEEDPSSGEEAETLHSYIPIVFYENGFYPVVGVKGKRPLIKVEGRLVKVRKDIGVFFSVSDSDVSPSIRTGRYIASVDTGVEYGLAVAGFGGGAISDPGSQGTAQSLPQQRRNLPGTIHNNSTERNATSPLWEDITPISSPLRNAYGVFIFYSAKGVVELHWRNIKDTPKGKKQRVKIPFSNKMTFKKNETLGYLFLAFQDGKELVPANDPQREALLKWFEASSTTRVSGS